MGAAGNTVLVTGGSGFIGLHLTNALAASGRDVIVLDTVPPKTPVTGARFVVGDVQDQTQVDALLDKVSAVVHLAAVVGIPAYLERPANVIDVNVGGTRNILNGCLERDLPVVLASSSEVYGNNAAELTEESPCVYGPPSRTRWCYAVSKAAAEHLAFALSGKGLRFSIVRYFNVYGPNMDEAGSPRVLRAFLDALEKREPLPLVDGGQSVRCFCYVDDAVRGTIAVLEAIERHESGVHQRAINIGRVEPVNMRSLAEKIIEITGASIGVRHVVGQTHYGPGYEDIDRRVPNVSRAQEVLGFHADTPLSEGLRRTLEAEGIPVVREGRNLTIKPVPWVKPSLEPGPELMSTIRNALVSGRVTNEGPLVQAFEKAAAAYFGQPAVHAVSSGSAALTLAAAAMRSEGVAILPSFTFIATASAAVHAGLRLVFCDVDPIRWTLDPTHLAELLQAHPDASLIIPVNVYGVPPDLPAICNLAQRHGARVLYDDAHGFGTEIDGIRHPAGPTVRTLSLHATKVLPAVEGGLLLTDDVELAARMRQLGAHGLANDRRASIPGYNFRMDELRAAVALNSLASFPVVLERRRRDAERLRAHIQSVGASVFKLQQTPDGVRTNHTNFVIQIPDAVTRGLEPYEAAFAEAGIVTRRYFDPPLHRLRAFESTQELPQTDLLSRTLLSLPLHSRMSHDHLDRVEAAVSDVAARFA